MRRKTAMCWPLSLRSSGAVAARPNGSTGVCRGAGDAMSKQRHLLLMAGLLLMTAPAGVGQVSTAKPGEPVERHLSSDQTLREWSHDSKPTGETKLIKVCRVETVM